MRKIIIIRKVVVAIIALFVVILINEIIHEFIKDTLINICFFIISIAGFLLFLTNFSEKVVKFCKELLSKFEKNLWMSIKDSVYINIIHYIEQQGKMPICIIYKLMIIYKDNAKICKVLKKILIKIYNSDDKSKDIISYIFLSCQNNNIISTMFDKKQQLKNQCEMLSKDNVNFALKYDIKNNGISDKFIVGLLHICLPNSNLCKDKTIYLLRCLLGWILEKQSKTVTDEEKNTLINLVALLPLIKHRLQDADFTDEYIIHTFDKIEQSKWLKELVDKSFDYIFVQLDCDLNNWLTISNNIKHICIVHTYYDKLFLGRRERLYKKIKSMNRKLTFLEPDEKMLTLLLYTSPMENFNKNEELIYKLATIACLCACQFIKI